jgi:hypothetical protein
VRWVRSAVRRPNRCAVVSFIGQDHPEGFIDCDTEFWGEHVYVSVVAVKEMAKLIGLPTKQEYNDARRRGDDMARHVEELEARCEALAGQLEAVHTLKAAGYSSQRKPGRKPAEKVEA